MSDRSKFYLVGLAVALALIALPLAGCVVPKPQKGGQSDVSLGSDTGATSAKLTAPENPKTSTKQTVERTTVREWSETGGAIIAADQPSGASAARQAGGARPLRETISEKSTVELGSSWEDKARELGARLANMRGVLWAGVALLIGGPIVGWQMGWVLNGLIAGGVGLLLIILSTVIPGNEAWFGLGGLLLIPLVAYVYYRAHYDANKDGIPDRLQRGTTPTPST